MHKGVQTIFSSFLFVLILRAGPLIIYSPPFINDAEIIQINIRITCSSEKNKTL